jgi:hypothetical protein
MRGYIAKIDFFKKVCFYKMLEFSENFSLLFGIVADLIPADV